MIKAIEPQRLRIMRSRTTRVSDYMTQLELHLHIGKSILHMQGGFPL